MDSPGNVDEAQEKLFGGNSSGPTIEITEKSKFVPDPKNGDTKIDMSDVKQVFVGMGKEELMQFANNPFYVRMRWFLFILFWLTWFGMLAGAIAIILLAPKCSAPGPSKWYQESPIYHLNLKNFRDSADDGIGDLVGLESKLDYFKDLGVEAILLDPIMQAADGTDDITDFYSINPAYGSFNDLKKLVSSAKEKGLHLLMKMIPNFSSIQHVWFNKSVIQEEPFKDYYVWTDPKFDTDGKPIPINNWLSVNGGSAWTYNSHRKQFYLHQFNANQPDLNFRNKEVQKYFEEVFKFWLNNGFEGLYLDKVEHLVEDEKFRDEAGTGGVPGKIHDEYNFLTHSQTTHLQESWNILSQWSNIFKSHSAILAVSGVPDLNEPDIIWRPIKAYNSLSASELGEILMARLNESSQGWEFSCDGCDERLRIGLQAVLLMLPGASLLTSGLELGLPPSSVFQWTSDSENHGFTSGKPWKPFSNGFGDRSVNVEKTLPGSYLSVFQKIIQERRDPSVLQGMTNLKRQDSVLAFTRGKIGSPHYLIIFNLEDGNRTISLEPFFGDDYINLTMKTSIGYNQTMHHGSYIYSSKDGVMSLEVPSSSFAIYQFIPDSN